MHNENQTRATDSRRQLRQRFKAKRNALSVDEQTKAADDIVHMAIKHKIFDGVTRVALYTSVKGELNTQPLITYLWENAVDVYLPVVHPFCKGYLIFLQYEKTSTMVHNQFGILEPELDVQKLCPASNLDIIFTPLVAFDNRGNRLGMGGGFYDRSLQNIQHNKQAKKTSFSSKRTSIIGLAHDVQHCANLPTQTWDVPLPMVLTPTHLHKF